MLNLCSTENSVSFEASSSLSDIFFDNLNHKICNVRANGAMGVTVKGPTPRDSFSFRLRDLGNIKTLKFSPNFQMACIQRDLSSVNFVLLNSEMEKSNENEMSMEFSQSCKMRNALILGLEWITAVQILFVTNQGLELYQVSPEKRTLRLLKTYNLCLIWFVYYPPSQLLIASSGINGIILNPFLIQNGTINRLAKFDVDLRSVSTKLLDRDVMVASIYGNLYVVIVRHGSRDADIALYQLSTDGGEEARLVHVLQLARSGMFAMHIIDNVIIVHHQTTQRSLLFDIKLQPWEALTVHQPLVEASIAASCSESVASYEPNMVPYSPNWVIFSPNLIIDARLGCMWTLSMELQSAALLIRDKMTLIGFLMNRNGAKFLLLETMRSAIAEMAITLKQMGTLFGWLVHAFIQTGIFIHKPAPDSTSKVQIRVDAYSPVVVEQPDVYSVIFLPLSEMKDLSKKYLADTMLEYLLSLLEQSIEVQPFFLEILATTLVAAKDFPRLQQLLQYRVITDAKPLAFLLLSLEAKHPPLIQLAIDMLSRLGTANEEIVEVLLCNGNVIEAIRYAETSGVIDRINPLKFIESAWQQDRIVKYAVFSYLQERALKNKTVLAAGRPFERFARDFKSMYENEALESYDY